MDGISNSPKIANVLPVKEWSSAPFSSGFFLSGWLIHDELFLLRMMPASWYGQIAHIRHFPVDDCPHHQQRMLQSRCSLEPPENLQARQDNHGKNGILPQINMWRVLQMLLIMRMITIFFGFWLRETMDQWCHFFPQVYLWQVPVHRIQHIQLLPVPGFSPPA